MSISKSETENIQSIFNGNIFNIPSYQRKYSWTDRERKELWRDIKEAKGGDLNHFAGTLIFQKSRESGLDEIYDIIDGQQRLTTIFILLNELTLKLEDSLQGQYRDRFILNFGKVKLSPLGKDREFIEALILKPKEIDIEKIESRSQINLFNAKRVFENLLKGYDSLEARELLDFILIKVKFLILVVENQSEAVRMFEITNDRGLPLSYLDKVKSILMLYSTMYLDGDLNEHINNSFETIFDANDHIMIQKDELKILGRFDERETLFTQHYITAWSFLPDSWNYRSGAKTIFESIKNRCEVLKENREELKDFIENYSKDFADFSQSYGDLLSFIKSEENENRYRYAEAFQFLEFSATLYPLIVLLFQQKRLDGLLDILISVEVRVFKFKGTNPRADIPNLCHGILDTEDVWSDKDIEEWLIWFRDKFMNSGNFKYYLDDTIYGNSAVKYILYRYNNSLSQNSLINSFEDYQNLQVEHIFPSGGKDGVNFDVTQYNFKDSDDYEYEKDRIGNLTLLEQRLNAGKEVSDLTPKEKVSGYLKSNVYYTSGILASMIDKDGFDKGSIQDNSNQIIKFCLENF